MRMLGFANSKTSVCFDISTVPQPKQCFRLVIQLSPSQVAHDQYYFLKRATSRVMFHKELMEKVYLPILRAQQAKYSNKLQK